MSANTPKPRKQVGALPVRRSKDGKVEVLLVTSRISRNWLIPKGWPIKGKGGPASAAQEALEEAGIVCKPGAKLGSYDYVKVKPDGSGVPCTVQVYGMKVTEERDTWRERGQRERRWMSPWEAAAIVYESGLAEFLRDFAAKNYPDGDLRLASGRGYLGATTETEMTLQELRTATADNIATNFDFSYSVVAANGWEQTTPGTEMTKVYFFENPEDSSLDSIQGHFTVVFADETSATPIEAYASVDGEIVGNLMGGQLSDYMVDEADLQTAPGPR